MSNQTLLLISLLSLTTPGWTAMTPEVAQLRSGWEQIKYHTPTASQELAYAKLAQEAAQVSTAQPGQAEPLIWQAIILASQAGAKGGLGALSLVKQARELLEQAEQLDPKALDGSVYTSLGSLYYQVPGWPIGFGDDDKARDYLQKALSVNPDGIDANYFYGDFLLDQGDYRGAVAALEKALQAPARPGREVADAGRRQEVLVDLSKARSKLD